MSGDYVVNRRESVVPCRIVLVMFHGQIVPRNGEKTHMAVEAFHERQALPTVKLVAKT